MAERKFSFTKGLGDNNIGSAGEELRKIESKKDFDYKVIPREKIIPNPKNDYPIEDIRKLMNSIKSTKTLIHIPRVKQVEDGYMIIAGERRIRAITLGIEEGHPEFEKFNIGIPCMVSDKDISDVDEEIQLIAANEEVRDEDEARKRKKIKRLYELYEMKNINAGEVISISKQVSEQLGIGERQVQRYAAVNNKLIPRLQEAFDKKEIQLTYAAQVSALDDGAQNVIADILAENKDLTNNDKETLIKQAKKQKEKEESTKTKKDKIEGIENLPQDKQKQLMAEYEIKAMISNIERQLNSLNKAGKTYYDQFKYPIQELENFSEEAIKTLSELQSLGR